MSGVRETSQSPQTSAPTFTRSKSPDYGFPAPATAHQAPLYQGSLTPRSSSVYRSLPRTVPDSQSTNLCVLTFQFPSCLLRSSCVFPFVILPTALALLQTKDILSIVHVIQRTICCISPYLHSSHPYSSVIQINLLSLTYLSVSDPFCDRRLDQEQHLYGSPSAITRRGPGGIGQQPPGLSHADHKSPSASVCPMALPASYAGEAAECGRLPPTSGTVHRDAVAEIHNRTL